MKNYKYIATTTKFLESVVCDKCKTVYSVDDVLELQEFHHISFTGGYDSVFGDMTKVECDICQHCLKEMIGSFCRMENLY